MTPLPPDLALLRLDIATAARRRAARHRRLRRALRAGLVALVGFGGAGTLAVATGVVGFGHEAPLTVTVVGPDGVRESATCTKTAGGELCAFRHGDGVGTAQVARALARRGATFGRTETVSARPGRRSSTRTGIRVGEKPAGAGGYRSGGPLTITITVDDQLPVTCDRDTTERACRVYRTVIKRTVAPDFPRLLTRLDAARVTIETTSTCVLAARYTCRGAPLAEAVARSRDPRLIPLPGTTYSYAKLELRGV